MNEEETESVVDEKDRYRLSNILGRNNEDNFEDFNLKEIQEILAELSNQTPFDLAHGELMQQQSLRAADVCAEFLGKLQKTISFYESKINSLKNKTAMDYKTTDGSKATMDMRKFAAESSPEVEEYQIKLAKAKGAKLLLDKKYEILIKQHHFIKEICVGLKKTF